MTKTIILTLLIAGVFIAGSLATNEAYAAVDMFLKIEGVDGESQADGHKGEIDIESWSWGETNSANQGHGGGQGAGKVSLQDFHFVMNVNKATPKLMQACADGKHIDEAVLTLRKAGDSTTREPVEYLIIKMKKIIVSSYQTGGSADDDVVPVDSVSLNFQEIEFSYQQQDDQGEPVGDRVTGSASKKGRA